MAGLNPRIIESIKSLLWSYKYDVESPHITWWFRWFFSLRLWLFFPSSLKKAFKQIEAQNGNAQAVYQYCINSDNAQAVYHSLINETWFFQRWFIYYLGDFFRGGLGEEFKRLNNPLLTTPHYFNLISTHATPYDMAWAIDMLSKANLLTPTNEATLLKFDDSTLLNEGYPFRNDNSRLLNVSRLLGSGILTQENLDICLTSRDYVSAVRGLRLLANAGLYTSSNREAFLSCESLYWAECALANMSQVGLFSWTGLSNGILTQENFNVLINHRNIQGASAVVQELWNCGYTLGILTHANFVRALSLPNPQILAAALHVLRSSDFNQTIDYLFQHADVLLTDAAGQLWSRIPRQPAILDAVRQICDDTNVPIITRRRNFAHYVNRLLGQNNDGMRPLNDNQSTHTASVHASVSQSASKLLERYGSKIIGNNLEDLCNTISNALNNLSDDNPHHQAAKKCLARITAPDFVFFDLDSQVSIKQLVALSWLVIHDNALRRGSLEEAQTQFIEGLYEIQRGYNLSGENIDNQQADKPICLAGTFNKLVEKLASIHPDCEIRVVTKALATLKLPQEVKAQATRFLQQHIKPPSEEKGYLTFNALSEQIKQRGTEVIWTDIKNAVSEHMFEEFGSLYHNNKDDKDFNNLIDCGEQCDIITSVAEVKLSIIIREEANLYMEQYAQNDSVAISTLIEQIVKNGGIVIWPQIKERVAARLFEEFKMHYNNDKEDKRFQSLIDEGKHCDVVKCELLRMARQHQKPLPPGASGFFSLSNDRSTLDKIKSNNDVPTNQSSHRG